MENVDMSEMKNECKELSSVTGSGWHGGGVADFECNKCKCVYQRDLGWKLWTPSYCEKTDQPARLYRISAPNVDGDGRREPAPPRQ